LDSVARRSTLMVTAASAQKPCTQPHAGCYNSSPPAEPPPCSEMSALSETPRPHWNQSSLAHMIRNLRQPDQQQSQPPG
ncbi:hypothetical protein PIB30_114631, partial [Stylosanthes scabra]|nr:hypothetical protein [Stylosanthes scabra]